MDLAQAKAEVDEIAPPGEVDKRIQEQEHKMDQIFRNMNRPRVRSMETEVKQPQMPNDSLNKYTRDSITQAHHPSNENPLYPANQSYKPGPLPDPSNNQSVCYYCGKNGHWIAHCNLRNVRTSTSEKPKLQ